MFSLQLTNGTLIKGLKRINPSTFEFISDDSQIYHLLNDSNLSIAILLNEDGIMEDVFLDYTRQNYIQQCGIIRFRIMSIEQKERGKKK